FRRGANFAVGSATALDAAFFHGGKFPLNVSLGVQLQWFESLKPSLLHLRCRVQGLLRQIPLLCGRIRGQRLRLLFPHQERARDHAARSRCHQDHLNGHRGTSSTMDVNVASHQPALQHCAVLI
uniref:Uncharacterized protein n=1 Tax=Aegilops tauschii subsp. strangulata TaxID=200361 RepID=A0A453EGF7_AEGTS